MLFRERIEEEKESMNTHTHTHGENKLSSTHQAKLNPVLMDSAQLMSVIKQAIMRC